MKMIPAIHGALVITVFLLCISCEKLEHDNPFDPEFKPVIIGSCDTPGSANGVAVAGGYAFVANGSSGSQIIRCPRQ